MADVEQQGVVPDIIPSPSPSPSPSAWASVIHSARSLHLLRSLRRWRRTGISFLPPTAARRPASLAWRRLEALASQIPIVPGAWDRLYIDLEFVRNRETPEPATRKQPPSAPASAEHGIGVPASPIEPIRAGLSSTLVGAFQALRAQQRGKQVAVEQELFAGRRSAVVHQAVERQQEGAADGA